MNRKLALATLVILTIVVAILAYQLRPRGQRFFGEDSRPELATAGQTEASPWNDDLTSLGWNRFRGPNGIGTAQANGIPNRWDDDRNLLWKQQLPGPGSSSPVLTETRVFVTCYSGYGVQPRDPGDIQDLKRHLLCLDRATGEILWSREIPAVQPESPWGGNGLPEHGYATNTPVTDGKSVFAFFGKSGVYAYDLEGNLLWNQSVGTGLNQRGWGSCASPILFNDLVIINAAEESGALIALSKDNGKEVWRAESPRLPMSFTTPVLVPVDANRTDLIMPVIGEIWGLNPVNGKLVWYCESPIGGNVSPVPMILGDTVICSGGYQDTGTICVQVGGTGDVSKTHVRWTSEESSYISSPILVDDEIYWIGSDRIYHCLDARTGESLVKQRAPSEFGTGRGTYASPVLLGKNILLQTKNRGVVVFEAIPELEILTTNEFANDKSAFNATPAIGNGQLFLRSNQYLYCVQDLNPVGDSAEPRP